MLMAEGNPSDCDGALVASFKIESSVEPSTAPARVCVVPSEPTMTKAGCTGTSKRRYTSPESSLTVGKVNSYLSMKPWKVASSPAQATPMNSTDPAHRLRAASTEAASRLQMLQVGAQNQNTTGRPANSDPTNSPPPTNRARKSNAVGTPASPAARVGTEPSSARGVAPEHPVTKPASTIAAIAVT